MNHPGKIVLIGTAHPLRGGLATFNERLIAEYRKDGHDAVIYTFSLQYPSVLFPGKTQYSTETAPPGLPVHVRVNSINPLNWLSVGFELKRMKPDLVLVKYWMPFMAPCFGTICRIIRGNKHTRIITIIDNLIPHEHRPGDRMLSSYWIGSVDGCVAMSKSVLTELETFDPAKPKQYCPHPLYDNFGAAMSREAALEFLKLDPAFRYALFFGFIRDYKGLDLLLEAFGDPRFETSGLKLIVAGEFYGDPAPYLAIIHKHGMADRIVLKTDFIPDSQVRYYFSAADLVVQPYKSATQSGVTQIAYHFNKPMIITNVGGLAEFVPDGRVGFVVPPEPPAIAGAILKYFRDGLMEEFSKQAAIEKTKYSWNAMIRAIDLLI